MSAIVLLSGGLDSAVNLKRADDDTGVALALTFDYGQRAAARENAAAAAMCRRMALPHCLVRLPWMASLRASALTNPAADLPPVTAQQLDQPRVTSGQTARAVWVPNRNGAFIAIAAAYAEALEADRVVVGFNAEEAATFADNSPEFVAATNRALQYSTRSRVQVVSYTQHLQKVDIVRLGREIGAPIDLVWSCYQGGDEHCGQCESCARLERALRAAGAWDWFWRQRR